jgi:hypothetical protein
MRLVEIGPYWDGMFWIRILGRGFSIVDHRLHKPLFTERNGYKAYIHIGPYCFKYLEKVK